MPQFDTTGKVYNLSPMGNEPQKKLYYTTGTSWGGTEVEYSFGFAKHHIQVSTTYIARPGCMIFCGTEEWVDLANV